MCQGQKEKLIILYNYVLLFITNVTTYFVFQILPDGYFYRLCEAEMDDSGSAKLKFYMKLMSQLEVEEWLDSFQSTSLTTYRQKQKRKYKGAKTIFSVSYKPIFISIL